MKKKLILLATLLCASFFINASEIKLKDGKVIQGNIISETDDTITLSVTINKRDIESAGYFNGTTKTNDFPKPIKKVPITPGNFEVFDGTAVAAPIDTDRLENAIKSSLLRHGYRILSQEPGVITYMLYKNDWDLTMKFCYCQDEYWYEYVSSRNLGANPERNKIHKNYQKWIITLEKEIRAFY